MSLLEPREAYRRWASTYEAGNAFGELERALVDELGPSPAGRRLLDAGCGTGRRLANTGAAHATGLDLSPEMLAVGRANAGLAGIALLEGDVRSMPFEAGSFDLVWCRLVVGHVPDPGQAYRELARVTARGGTVIVTDFHPAALAAGMRRTFRDGDEVHEVLTYPHSVELHLVAARQAGLTLRRRMDARIGPEVRHMFLQCGRGDLYDRRCGEPVVLGLAFLRDG